MLRRFAVVPKRSWGRLAPPKRKRWAELDCDRHVAGIDVSSKRSSDADSPAPPFGTKRRRRERASPLASSPGSATPTPVPIVQRGRCADNDKNATRPLVAVCCGTTTREKRKDGTVGYIHRVDELQKLALFKHLLPSFKRTAECGFRYVVVVGYDVGDKFWDSEDGLRRATAWFRDEIADPLRKERNIEASLEYARVQNHVRKPGPVFSAITRRAFRDVGADYVYRVNDDTALDAPWARAFVRALESLGNLGVVGPACDQGNRRILTHDFTHKTHVEVFGDDYYPPALSDWWMDDWISRVYGPERTLRATDVKVTHHTFHHGQRYAVDNNHKFLLDGLISDGRAKIRHYVAQRWHHHRKMLTETNNNNNADRSPGDVRHTNGGGHESSAPSFLSTLREHPLMAAADPDQPLHVVGPPPAGFARLYFRAKFKRKRRGGA